MEMRQLFLKKITDTGNGHMRDCHMSPLEHEYMIWYLAHDDMPPLEKVNEGKSQEAVVSPAFKQKKKK